MTDGAAVLIAIILLLTSRMTGQNKSLSDRIFKLIIYIAIFGAVMDYLSVWIDGTSFPHSVPLFYIINSLMFPNAQIISYLWILYVYVYITNATKPEKLRFFLFSLPLLITIILLLSNYYTGIFFTMDENHYYIRGPLGALGFIIGGIYMIITIIMSLVSNRSREDYLFFPIFNFMIPAFLGTLTQMMFYYVNVVWLGVSIGITATFMSLQNRLIFIDALTGLYNRAYLNYFMQKTLRKKTVYNTGVPLFGGIMLDINLFKGINDEFGHSVGDMAIVDAANIIKNSIGKNSISIRFAGDEFIVIVKTSLQEDVFNVMNRIRENAKAFQGKDYPYKISFSMGCSMYILGEDTADSFLSKIDAKMYEEKRILRGRRAEDRQS